MSNAKRGWQDYVEWRRGSYHTVVGKLLIREKVWSPQLNNQRNLLVYLPPSYEQSEQRYPVLYMHDGQNLFDQATSYSEEWRVDETMQKLSDEGMEAIVVGIPNMQVHRLAEYSPFHDAYHGPGRGDRYLSFLVETVKPLIDGHFRTLPGRAHTGMLGSSMGGLISLYGFFRHSNVFGFTGIMSPALWYANRAIYAFVRHTPFVPGKIYMDVGTREYGGVPEQAGRKRSRRYYASIRRMKRILVKKGYRPVRDLCAVEEKWAAHDETAWARRLPLALRFLLGEAGAPAETPPEAQVP